MEVLKKASGRVCCKCLIWKESTEFHETSANKLKLYRHCKDCVSKYKFLSKNKVKKACPITELFSRCCRCGVDLGSALFYKTRVTSNGLSKICKPCLRKSGIARPSGRFAIVKDCITCGRELPESEYRKARRTKIGSLGKCRDCCRCLSLGITIDQLLLLRELSGNRCQGCGKEFSRRFRMDFECIDHSHTTGKVRGLLCGACNSVLGYVEDRPEPLIALADYLRNSK